MSIPAVSSFLSLKDDTVVFFLIFQKFSIVSMLAFKSNKNNYIKN